MKSKNYHTIRTISKLHIKILERGKIGNPNTKHMTATLSCL